MTLITSRGVDLVLTYFGYQHFLCSQYMEKEDLRELHELVLDMKDSDVAGKKPPSNMEDDVL